MHKPGKSAQPRRRRTRRFAFLTLLLLALAAPIGWVAASVPTSPYVVVFTDDAVTVADGAQSLTGTTMTAIRAANAPRQPVLSAVAGSSDGIAHRHVDANRVALHVQDVAARNGVNDIEDVYSAALGGFSARLTADQYASISADPSVAGVIPDEAISIDDVTGGLGGSIRTTSNPSERVQPGVRRVGARAPTVAALTAGGLKVDADVAIIDTGIQRDHPDLNVVGGYNCTGRDRSKWDDNDGHGTHVAGIVGALDNHIGVTGVAPGVRLWAVKVLDGNGHGFVSWLVCGIDWVTAQRDRANPSRSLIEVANMSLAFTRPGGSDHNCGRSNNDTVHAAICRSVDRGTVYVAAAGNDSRDVKRYRPADYDEVIAVSAMADYDGRGGGHGRPSDSCPYWSSEPDDAFTSFSNYGPDVDLIAPGKCILSTYPRNRYAWMSGTSMASPHVTGAAVIYKTLFPRATPAQVRMALMAVGTLDWRTSTDPDNTHEKAVWIGQFRAMPDFGISTTLDSAVVSPGGSLPVSVSVARVGGFDSAVTVSLLNPPSGISAIPVVSRGSTASLTVSVAAGTRVGTYNLTVAAASGDVVRTSGISIVVRGSSSPVSFTSPRGDLTVQAATDVSVAWSQQSGNADVASARLERQAATIQSPGTCDDVAWHGDQTRTVSGAVTDHVHTGSCYRWVLTLTDSAGLTSTVYSGAVLVDATAPRTPSVQLAGETAGTPDLADLGIGHVYISSSGVVWLRGGKSGSVGFEVSSSDAESGIARNLAAIDGRGWRVQWAGSPEDGSLRLIYGPQSSAARLSVSGVNGTGMAGPAATLTLMPDANAPTAATWLSAPASTTRTSRGAYFKLAWTGGSDSGAGLASRQIVARYISSLRTDGTCRTNGFAIDGGFRLMSDNSWDSGLVPNACYAWTVRTVDNVGNVSAPTVSGYVITEPR